MSDKLTTIEVNMNNLSLKEKEQLSMLVEKSLQPDEWWRNTIFDVKMGTDYFYIDSISMVQSAFCSGYDNDTMRKRIGNACTDFEYMKGLSRDINMYRRVANFAKIANGDWEAIWTNSIQPKYYIYWDAVRSCYLVNCTYTERMLGIVVFESRSAALQCIEEVILPYITKKKEVLKSE